MKNEEHNTEIWKDVKGYEGIYQVSNHGRLKSFDRHIIDNRWGGTKFKKGRIHNLEDAHRGYRRASLNKDCVRKRIFIHRLVAEAFIPNPENKPYINHIDENPSNNHVLNLEWCTHKENVNHGTATERRRQKMLNKGGRLKAKKVYQYDKDLNLVNTYPSHMEAQRNGFTQANISKVCSGERPHHKGFIWSHKKLK